MRIAILGIRGIPARYGGFEMNAEETALFLARQGHSVVVYGRESVKRPENWPDTLELMRVPTIQGKYLSTFSNTFFALIHSLLRKNDVWHIYNAGNGPLLFLTWILGKKTIVSVDGLEWMRKKYPWPAKMIFKFSAWCATKWATILIADSKHVARYYQQHFGVKPVFMPYGAEVLNGANMRKRAQDKNGEEKFEKWRRREMPKRYCLCVSRFVPEKNIPLLVEAYKKSIFKIPLVVVGGNSENTIYEKLARKTGRGDERIKFVGQIWGEEMNEWYKNAEIYLSASELEGTSPALVRAMGAGKAVLVADIPENRETLGEAGFYHKAGDERSLTDRLNWMARNPEMIKIFGEKARARAEKCYNWEKILDDYLKLLQKIFKQLGRGKIRD